MVKITSEQKGKKHKKIYKKGEIIPAYYYYMNLEKSETDFFIKFKSDWILEKD